MSYNNINRKGFYSKCRFNYKSDKKSLLRRCGYKVDTYEKTNMLFMSKDGTIHIRHLFIYEPQSRINYK